VKEFICETLLKNVLEAAQQPKPLVKVAQLAAMTEDRGCLQQKCCHYDLQLVESERALNAAKNTESRVAQKQAGRFWSARRRTGS
jgi:hypothetical protein